MLLCNNAIIQHFKCAIMQICDQDIIPLCNYAIIKFRIIKLCNYAILQLLQFCKYKIKRSGNQLIMGSANYFILVQ